jgi:hypothetical protein
MAEILQTIDFSESDETTVVKSHGLNATSSRNSVKMFFFKLERQMTHRAQQRCK